MPQYLGGGLGKAQIKAIRVTKLNADCTPVIAPAAVQCTIVDCISNISTDISIEAGTRIAPKSASGTECWEIAAKDNLQYVTFPTFQILTQLMKAASIMTGVTTYDLPVAATTNGGNTFAYSRPLGLVGDHKFALEIWSTVAGPPSGGSCVATSATGVPLTWYELYPQVINGVLGSAVTRDETTPHFLSISNARGYGNPTWGAGPTVAPMPGGAVMPGTHGEFMGYYVDANGIPLAVPAASC